MTKGETLNLFLKSHSKRSTHPKHGRGRSVSWAVGLILILVLTMIPFPGFAASAQQQRPGSLRGRVLDETEALIPGATVRVSGPDGFERTVTTDETGRFRIDGLTPGRYRVEVTATGFDPSEGHTVEIAAGKRAQLDVTLRVAVMREEVTVEGRGAGEVSVAADQNVGAIILRGEDLDMLSDDPDDLAAELQALAGPSAGPQGGQIFVDGFSGARLPPKDSIREIRINSDPFSAQYDRLGFGRIQIFTKPGSDKWRGSLSFGFSDETLNSRNPFAVNKPPYQSRQFSGSLSGPMGKKASLSFDVQQREIDGNAVINATVLDAALEPVGFSQAVVTPQERTTLGPRIDYQLSEKVTLTGRYRYFRNNLDNTGLGGFSLPAVAYDTVSEGHTVQLSGNATISARTVNETRFQFRDNESGQNGDNTLPTLIVQEAFRDGGAQVGQSGSQSANWELQNHTTTVRGPHTIKFGARLRRADDSNTALNNFGGTFTFAGRLGPLLDASDQVVLDGGGQPILIPVTSIESYRRTLVFEMQGLTPAEIRTLGGGASQFTLSAGTPVSAVDQTDLGVYLLDDWRARSNLSLSLGLRYESQDNITDSTNFAPRAGFAWAPGGTKGKRGKTVIRGGFGIFYDRISRNLTLQTIRFDGATQQQFIVQDPDFFPTVPDAATLEAALASQTIREIDPAIQAPRLMQTAIGVERALPRNTTVAVNYTHSRGSRNLRSRNLNAPDPITGIRPFGNDSVFLYESTGRYRQNQLITNLRTRFASGVSLFGFYALNKAKSDTNGAGSFPADPNDLAAEWGAASNDIRHRVVLGGSLTAPLGLRFSPFIIVNSGGPFNITTGEDINGDLIFTDRPSFGTDLTDPDVVETRFGTFNRTPELGEALIPRNFGRGPSRTLVNLRISRSFGFGERAQSTDTQTPQRERRGGFGRGGGGRGGGRGGGGRGGGGRGGGRGGGGRGGDSRSRYTLTITASAQNILNITNAGQPIGNLSSPRFGESNSTSGFGRGRSGAGNRTITFQARFRF